MGTLRSERLLADTRTRWRGHLSDYDYVFGLPEDGCFYCLDKQEVALILSLITPARWPTRWTSPTDQEIDRAQLEALVNRLEYDLMDERCGDMRTEHWRNRQALILVLNRQRAAAYTGTPSSVHPLCPDDNFDGDAGEAATDALCHAVQAWVALKVLETLNLYRAAIGVAAAATGLLGLLTGGLGAIVGGIVVLLVGLTLAQLEAAAADDEAVKEVACRLFDALKGTAITEANLWSACDGLSGEGTEGTVVAVLQEPQNQNLANYLHLIELIGTATGSAGAMGDCPCDDGCEDCDQYHSEWIADMIESSGPYIDPEQTQTYDNGQPEGVYSYSRGTLTIDLGAEYCVKEWRVRFYANYSQANNPEFVTWNIGDHEINMSYRGVNGGQYTQFEEVLTVPQRVRYVYCDTHAEGSDYFYWGRCWFRYCVEE